LMRLRGGICAMTGERSVTSHCSNGTVPCACTADPGSSPQRCPGIT
jgi:hypothetical protein